MPEYPALFQEELKIVFARATEEELASIYSKSELPAKEVRARLRAAIRNVQPDVESEVSYGGSD